MNNEDFKKSLACFASGVTAITYLQQEDNTFSGITVSSFASLSLEPPLVLFNINKTAKSMNAFLENSKFVINILSKEQSQISNSLANPNANRDDCIKENGFTLFEKTPALNDCMSTLYCSTKQIIEAGDHNIIIANVLETKTDEKKEPLIYYNRDYRKIESL